MARGTVPARAQAARRVSAEPAWLHRLPFAPAGVAAAYTTRGTAADPFDLGTAVAPLEAVRARRSAFAQALGASPVWLKQVHGVRVVRLETDADAPPTPEADAAWTTEAGVACTVLVADCLPVLLATHDGRAVAAAHAGWRGLAAGVLEATVQAVCEGTGSKPQDLWAWLGPCIGPRQFEVGRDVLDAFTAEDELPAHFVTRPRPDGSPRWLADLVALATARLRRAGLHDLHVDGRCTVEEASTFFSFRRDGGSDRNGRDGINGRMAIAIWRFGR